VKAAKKILSLTLPVPTGQSPPRGGSCGARSTTRSWKPPSLVKLSLGLVLLFAPFRASAEDRWVSEDKFFHLSFSFGLVGLTYNGARTLDASHGKALVGAASLSLVIGLWKELRDREGEGFSWKDLAADCLGVMLGAWLSASKLR